jgi:4-amino-4-deoxy-L-arabinose transferase-like glycosyltransferase
MTISADANELPHGDACMNANVFSRERLILPIVIVLTMLGFYVRAAYNQETTVIDPIRVDASEYVTYGYNLWRHGVFSLDTSPTPRPDSFRGPGYPLLIAAALRWSGPQKAYATILMAQIVLSGLLIPLTYFIGVHLLRPSTAAIAAAAVALSPHLIAMTGYLLSETLLAFLVLASLWLFLEATRRNSLALHTVTGMLFGMAYLTTETTLFLPILLYGARFWRQWRTKSAMGKRRALSIGLAVFLVFPLGWSLRAALVVSGDSPNTRQRAVAVLAQGSYPGFVYQSEAYKYYPYREDPQQPEFSSSLERFVSIFYERFSQRPIRYLSWYLFEKPYYLWSWNILQGQGDVYVYPVKKSFFEAFSWAKALHTLMRLLHPVAVVLALMGVFGWIAGRFYIKVKGAGDPTPAPQTTMLIVLAYFTALHALFAGLPRYSIPLRPELYLVAVGVAYQLLNTIRGRSIKPEGIV